MIRRAKNVHIYFFRKNQHQKLEFAVMQRTDDINIFQGASGGVRDNETPEQAALRVASYEAGVSGVPLYRLTSMSYVPATIFGSYAAEWGGDVVVIPIYFFAMSVDEIKISEQHSDIKWHLYDEAFSLFTYESQKTGLWELNERLLRGNLERAV